MSFFRTMLLLAALTALFMGLGYTIGGSGGATIALVVAAGMNFFTYWNADKIVLRMHNAREVDARAAPQLHGIVRELAPVITGLMMAGRVGSAMAAELGTMQVTEQIDALHSLGRDPVRTLVARGAIVAAGHTAATYEQVRDGLDAGIRGFTHLYNAMSPLQGREPGAVGAALEDRDSWCGIIVDGVHVHAGSLRVALAAKPRGKLFLVTDAMPMVGGDDPAFELYGETITAVDGVVRNAAGSLAGSALDMATAVRNSVDLLGLPLEEAARMASRYPAEFLGIGERFGRIAAGYAADFVLLDDALGVRATWIAGDMARHVA